MAKQLEKIPAKFKTVPEDFIVEELAWEWNPKIEETPKFGQKPNLDKLKKEEPKDFVLCEFEKRDIDNFRAKKEFASQIKKGLDALGFAGIKDKKAVTVQRVSIFKPDLKLLEKFTHDNIYIKNAKWFKRKIKLGYLEGNRFTVTLRDIDSKEAIKVSNKIKKTTSFANFFGKQRFGSVRENNAKIGYLIVKKKYKEAIDAILLDTTDKERPEVQEARLKLAEEQNYKKALDYFPVYLKFERSILSYLVEKKKDFKGALRRAEKKSTLLFVHAFQSKMFNEILDHSLAEGIDFTTKGQKKIPLFGYKSKIDEGKLGEIEEEVLFVNNIKPEEFKLPDLPHLSLKGDYRNALIEVKDIEIDIKADEKNKGTKKILLKFSLPSGVYATTFLENFFDLIEIRDNG